MAKKIKSYDFFQYAVNEALFLSDKEEKVIVDILRNIEKDEIAYELGFEHPQSVQ